MKCPHCLVEIHPRVVIHYLGRDINDDLWARVLYCPNENCNKTSVFLEVGTYCSPPAIPNPKKSILVYPKGMNRTPLPSEVPEKFAEDYKQACLVLADSPKASAALSRRCLQNILREVAKVKPSDLSKEIQEVIDSKQLPSYISEIIDAVRIIGNFAAHPIKSKSTGEIVDVEPGEAELNLIVLEALFDFYFVQPAIMKRKKDVLNQKLADAGKPKIK